NGCVLLVVCGALSVPLGAPWVAAQSPPAEPGTKSSAPSKKGAKKQDKKDREAAKRFGKRADALLAAPPVSKGDWSLLIADAQTGESLYERDADKYYVPASNMKLFTTALALAKLGPDFRFQT